MQAQIPVMPTAEQQAMQEKLVVESKARRGISWFFWIAGLSILNSILYIAGANLYFVIGLGITQFVDAVATGLIQEIGVTYATLLHLIALGINIGFAGIFITAGLLSRKHYRWALIIGMVLYFMDAILMVLFQDWLGLAFHVLALFGLFGGLRALNQLKKMEKAQAGTITFAPATQELSLIKSPAIRIIASSIGIYIGLIIVLAVIGFILTR